MFHVIVTCNGTPEIRRVLNGLDRLMSWVSELKARLEVDGWRERPLAEFHSTHRGQPAVPIEASKMARQRIAAGERRPGR